MKCYLSSNSQNFLKKLKNNFEFEITSPKIVEEIEVKTDLTSTVIILQILKNYV